MVEHLETHIIPCSMRCSLQCASHVVHTLSVPDSASVPPVLFQTVLQNGTRMEHAKHHILSGAGCVDSVCDILVLSIAFFTIRGIGVISFVVPHLMRQAAVRCLLLLLLVLLRHLLLFLSWLIIRIILVR